MRAGTACGLLACVAVLFARQMPGMGALALLGLLTLASAGIALLRRNHPLLRRLAFVSAWLCASVVWTGLHLHAAVGARLDAPPEGLERRLTGVVVDLPVRRGRVLRLLVRPDPGQGLPERIRLNWYGEPGRSEPRAAERWLFDAKLRPPDGFSNPHGFDYGAWLLQRRIGALGYARDAPASRQLAPPSWRAAPLTRARAWLHRRLAEAMAPRPVDAVSALILGHGSDESRREVLRRTGTAHLFAISGLHLALASGWFNLVAAALWGMAGSPRGIPPRTVGLVAAMVMAGAYMALAGASLPTRRAALMLGVAVGAWLWARPVEPGRALAAAVAAVLIMDPLSPLDPGFWLSFLAVAAILWVGTGRAGVRPGLLRIQLAISLAMVPAGAWLAREVPLAGPLANLVAVPAFGLLVLPGLFLGTGLCLVWPAGGGALLRQVDGLLARGLDALTVLAEALPPVPVAEPGVPAMLAALGAALLAAAPRAWPGRPLWPLLLLPVFWPASDHRAHGAFSATFLDVGQGMAVVVETREHTLLYDLGPSFGSGSDTGALVVAPHLAARGRSPDWIVVSHGDDDHGGGLDSLRRRHPGAVLITGDKDPPPGSVRCRRGMHWRADGVRFEILHPAADTDFTGNDGSCVLRVRGTGGALLLTGDIERRAERDLLAELTPEALRADVVSVPHHGSATSSDRRFVEATGAAIAVVSAGRGNRWGFPSPEVIRRWRDAGAGTPVTGRDGAVTVRIEPQAGVVGPRRTRIEDRRAWMPATRR